MYKNFFDANKDQTLSKVAFVGNDGGSNISLEQLNFKRMDLWQKNNIISESEKPCEHLSVKCMEMPSETHVELPTVVLNQPFLEPFALQLKEIRIKAAESITMPVNYTPENVILKVEIENLQRFLTKQIDRLLHESTIEPSYRILWSELKLEFPIQKHYNLYNLFDLFTSELIKWFYVHFKAINNFELLFSDDYVVQLNLYLAFIFSIKGLLLLFFRNFKTQLFFSSNFYFTIKHFITKIYEKRRLYTPPTNNQERYNMGNPADKNFMLELDQNNRLLEKELKIPPKTNEINQI